MSSEKMIWSMQKLLEEDQKGLKDFKKRNRKLRIYNSNISLKCQKRKSICTLVHGREGQLIHIQMSFIYP